MTVNYLNLVKQEAVDQIFFFLCSLPINAASFWLDLVFIGYFASI